MGLPVYGRVTPLRWSSIRFLFVESEFCHQLPSDSTSRWTPLLRLAVPVITARRGLSPPRCTTCLAHQSGRCHHNGSVRRQRGNRLGWRESRRRVSGGWCLGRYRPIEYTILKSTGRSGNVCSGKNAELVKAKGADEVIDYTKHRFSESPQVKAAPFDIVFDNIGGREAHRSGWSFTTLPNPAVGSTWQRSSSASWPSESCTGVSPMKRLSVARSRSWRQNETKPERPLTGDSLLRTHASKCTISILPTIRLTEYLSMDGSVHGG